MSHDLPRRRPIAKARAKELRGDLTPAESLVWSMVRAKRLGGLKFHRQFPIGPYIADFYCPAQKLVVELDGESHDVRVEYDAARTEYFTQFGLQVLRVGNDDVLSNLEGVGVMILRAAGCDPVPWLEGRCRIPSSPWLSPPKRGRGDQAGRVR